ncbi:MAG: glycosyl hydrolase, partial [Acidobacteriaceae bacterium]
MKRTAAALLALFAVSPLSFSPADAQSQPSAGPTQSGFENPPDSAKPRAWWHWLSGNVTQPGITADLEWMKRVNIAGFQMFDGDLGSPLFVDKPLIWMQPDWKAAWHHAAAEADRLHLEMSMAASGGWSETAGPWVKPEQGMKKYVWSETEVDGPKAFAAVLPAPPRNLGKFQDMAAPPPLHFPAATDLPGAKPQPPQPPRPPVDPYYADVAVVAYRTPEDEQRVADLHPTITSSGGAIDGEKLMDGKYSTAVAVAVPEGDKTGWVQFAFQQPFRARAVTIGFTPAAAFSGGGLLKGEVQSSDDGNSWKTLTTLPGPPEAASVPFPIRTLTFPETTAKYFRVVAEPVRPNPMLASLGIAPPPRELHFTEIEFASSPRVAYWEDKASFGLSAESVTDATPDAPAADAIKTSDVIDLTSKMRPDGTLDWQVPAGKWTILRLGYSLTGEVNHPATPAATGLEVDKLSRKDVESYVEQYTKMISNVAGPYFGKSFQYFLMDSWEAGQENWTEQMMAEFRKRRGYDMTPYLPVLTGRVVGSAAASDAFLWDFRRTIADMLAENHYAVAAAYFKQHGIGLYAEAMGTDLPTTGDGLLNKGQVTIPMGEFWTPLPGQPDSPQHNADVREAASASHIYGKPLTATESFTTMPIVTPWGQSPFYLKPLADENFARGVNRIVFHTSDQQPFTDDAHKPGMTLGPFGQDYTRNITWAEQAKVWNTYLARCSYLLQQGRYVADVAYFYGEGAPATVPFWKPLSPALPTHYASDFINADVLLHHAGVRDGRLTLDSGMSYKVIAIQQDSRALTLPMLRKLRELVEGGVVLIAPKPEYSPSLSDGPDAANEVKTIADQMWGSGDSAQGHAVGKGKVYSAGTIEDVLQAEGIRPDFSSGALENVGQDVP